MGRYDAGDSTNANPSLFPQELQVKLYQVFIFSIPILFSIILFLLFYLLYLKRRAARNNTPSPTQRIQLSSTASHHSVVGCNAGIKGELKEKLQVIQFDERVKAREYLCCVCLGEFEMREELRQVPSCRHVFHGDCIDQWLQANATCPLCRCSLVSAAAAPFSSLCPVRLIPTTTTTQQQNQGVRTQSSPSRSTEHVIQISE